MLKKLLLAGLLGAGLGGCALPYSKLDEAGAPPPELMSVPALAITGSGPRVESRDSEKSAPKTGSELAVPRIISLPQVYSLILQGSPDLAATFMSVRAEEARILQAGLIPNPEVEVELEEFGGTGSRHGFGSSEVRIAFSQEIETGGKRSKRVSVARRRKHVASWDYLVRRADIFKDAADVLFEVVAAQQTLAVRAEDLRLARRLMRITDARVDAGQLSPVELQQARVRLSTSRIAYRRAEADLSEAKTRLASFWGARAPTFEKAVVTDSKNLRIAPLGSYLEAAERNPELQKTRAEVLLAKSVVRLEKARNIPNITIGAGTTRFIESRENALLVRLSVPIPVFGLNKGSIAAARSELRGAELDRDAKTLKLGAEIRAAYQRIRTAEAELKELDRTALPAARRAVTAAIRGFREGKFDFLAVLTAQSSLLDLRLQRVNSRGMYWKARAELARLVGRTILQPLTKT